MTSPIPTPHAYPKATSFQPKPNSDSNSWLSLEVGGIGFSSFSNGKSHNPKFPSKEEIGMSTSVHLVVLDPPDRFGTDQEIQEIKCEAYELLRDMSR